MAVRAARRARRAAGAFAGVAAVAWLAGESGPLSRADRAAFAAVRARRHPAGIAAARAISALAEPAVVYPAALLAGIGTVGRAGWRGTCVPVFVVASGAVTRRRASRVIARPRPPAEDWLTEPEGFSLPSKHTTVAALTAGACARAVGPPSLRYAAPALAAAAVGASRVYLGVHWPGDVLAGWLFAVGWLRLTDTR